MARLQVAEDVSSWMVAILLPTDVFHMLHGPCTQAGICPKEGLIDGNVEGQCSLPAKLGQQYARTEPWY
jgi:hypothetical protein